MSVTAPRHFTKEDFFHLPDRGVKVELVDGNLREVPTTVEHDVIGANLVALLVPAARGRGFVTISQAGFRMRSGNIRIPDVAYTRRERFPGGRPPTTFGDAAPDLCIEIIYPSEEAGERERKRREYFDSGAVLVWELFPESQMVQVYTDPVTFTTLGSPDALTGGDLLPNFQCGVADIFALD